MGEVLNKNSQKVFTTKSDFEKPQGEKRTNDEWEIRINKEIKKIIKELEERKTLGPDGVSGYILKECR